LDSRAEAIEGIERTIGELAGMFQQLTSMINAHGDLVTRYSLCAAGFDLFRIDANVEEVQLNVEGAQQQLMRYMSSISSNRWLMIRIFLILIFFFLVFVFFFA
jgi:syntaxin 5